MSDTRKVVINACFGGFSLSPLAVKRMAELQGRECYFFAMQREPLDIHKYHPVAVEDAKNDMMVSAFDIPDAHVRLMGRSDDWHTLSMEERQARNAEYSKHSIHDRDIPRHDPHLIQVVEELGAAASGMCAELRIVEIPADVEYEIDEYDGNEHIAEKHRTWR
jgi:hypothetical protein